MPSPRAVLPVLGWLAATAASIALASVALLPVLRTGTPRSVDAAVGVPVGLTPPAGGTAPGPSMPAPSSASPPASAPSSRGVPASSRSVSPPTVIDGWTVTTDADGQRAYVRSFRVDGGTTVIRMTAGRVHLVTATPNPGWTVTTVQNEPGNLAVQFTEPDHYYVIHALWHNDAPFASVSEVGG